MKKTKPPLLLILGLGLIVASLALVLFFGIRTRLGTETSQQTLLKLQELLPQRTAGVPELYPNSLMPVLEIDGVDYVAMLEVPAFDITLPVANQWDQQKLSACPALFWGSTYGSTLVIGGADTSHQFGFCDQIGHGSRITVTDMTGAQFDYTVTQVDRAKHAETQWLTQEDWDLTLFCHDLYSMEYVAVRCTFAYH